MSNESLKSRVLAECERLNGMEETPHPFRVKQDPEFPHLHHLYHKTANWPLLEISDTIPEDDCRWEWYSRLLCLPEEGRQQLELIWEESRVGVGDYLLELTNNLFKIQVYEMPDGWGWQLFFRTIASRCLELKGGFETEVDAIRAAKQAATDLVAKHLVLPSPAMGMVKAKPIEWGEWKVPTVVGSPRYIQSKSDDGMYVVYRYETGIYMSYYYGKAIDPTHTLSGEEAQSACQTHKNNCVAELASLADFTPAPDAQPLVDALKQAQSALQETMGEWSGIQFPYIPEHLIPASEAIAEIDAVLKDWEGKQ